MLLVFLLSVQFTLPSLTEWKLILTISSDEQSVPAFTCVGLWLPMWGSFCIPLLLELLCCRRYWPYDIFQSMCWYLWSALLGMACAYGTADCAMESIVISYHLTDLDVSSCYMSMTPLCFWARSKGMTKSASVHVDLIQVSSLIISWVTVMCCLMWHFQWSKLAGLK